MRVSSVYLTSIGEGLRNLSATLSGVEETLSAMLSSTTASLSDVPSHWTGPRSDAVIGAAEDYVGATGGRWSGGPALISQLRGVVDRWASSADSHAGELHSPESTLRQPADTPEQAEDHSQALEQVDAVQASWTVACTSFAGEVDSYRVPLNGAGAREAFNPLFPYPPLEGTDYTTAVSQFAVTSMVPISIIDPSGQTETAARARLDSLFDTDTGRLVFTIIETAHEEDIGESDEHWSDDDLHAASDPETVERHIRAIYAEAGQPINEADLALLVDETLAAAWSIRASRTDEWKDRDEDLGYFEHGFGEWLREDFAGPAAAFVATVGCVGAVTVATGGTVTAPAGGACVAFGGAVGDGVGTWANGGDLGDITAAALNPQARLVDFGTGFVVQAGFNRFLPGVSPAASAIPDTELLPASRGGIEPVLRGQAGVNQTGADLVESGGRVLGQEVTVQTPSGLRTRLDLWVELPNGQQAFLEVKTGTGAAMNANQAAAFPEIIASGGTPVGANAAAAGLDPGLALGPTHVWVVHQPWPLP